MQNLWPEYFEENNDPSPKTILEEQGKLLLQITGGLVFGEVEELDEFASLASPIQNDFFYSFYLRGKFVNDYKFNAFQFSHDITLYPVKIRLDEQVAQEIDLSRRSGGYIVDVSDHSGLEGFLGIIFKTKRFRTVIGSIMRLSK